MGRQLVTSLESVHEDTRREFQKRATEHEIIEKMQYMTFEDQCTNVREIANNVVILLEELYMKILSARWTTCTLKTDHKRIRTKLFQQRVL